VTHPAVPITSANAGRFDGDNHAIIGRSRVADALYTQRLPKLFVNGGSHG
jgi:hypothetical protein